MFHTWTSLASHMNASRHTHECVTSHKWMRHVTHVNASRHTHECVTSNTWMREWHTTNESRDTRDCSNESCHCSNEACHCSNDSFHCSNESCHCSNESCHAHQSQRVLQTNASTYESRHPMSHVTHHLLALAYRRVGSCEKSMCTLVYFAGILAWV